MWFFPLSSSTLNYCPIFCHFGLSSFFMFCSPRFPFFPFFFPFSLLPHSFPVSVISYSPPSFSPTHLLPPHLTSSASFSPTLLPILHLFTNFFIFFFISLPLLFLCLLIFHLLFLLISPLFLIFSFHYSSHPSSLHSLFIFRFASPSLLLPCLLIFHLFTHFSSFSSPLLLFSFLPLAITRPLSFHSQLSLATHLIFAS